MTAHHYWYFAAFVMVIIGWGARAHADDNVTIYGEGSSSSNTATTTTTGNGTTAKSRHRHQKTSAATTDAAASAAAAAKKKSTVAQPSPNVALNPTTAPAQFSPAAAEPPPITVPAAPPAHAANSPSAPLPSATGPVTVTAPTWTPHDQPQITVSAPVPAAPAPEPGSPSDKPQIETGLPVARPGSKTYTLAGSFPLPPVIPVSATTSAFGDQKGLADDMSFAKFTGRPKNTYPWKARIITTKFWIGEGSTPISSTDNVESAWDENWRADNNGTDTPNDRDEYAPAHHIAGINPFYVALPFNDLAFPDKARRWLPPGWYRPPGRDGKQVSACQHRWVEIKNAQGDVCYAQWEDVGPLRYDHAEYVFGNERPDTYTRAGLDVSPAVFDYLGLDDRKINITSWRFVDDADVQPGAWLKYDEEVLLLKAIRANNDKDVPIERARAPISDPDDIDSSQKKVSKAKG